MNFASPPPLDAVLLAFADRGGEAQGGGPSPLLLDPSGATSPSPEADDERGPSMVRV